MTDEQKSEKKKAKPSLDKRKVKKKANVRGSRPKRDYTKIGENEILWTTVFPYNLKLWENDPHEDTEEPGMEFFLSITNTITHQTVTLVLTSFTDQELTAFGDFIAQAVGRVKETVQARDAYAQEQFSNGNDSFKRLYRGLPVIHSRQRRQPEHGESLPG